MPEPKIGFGRRNPHCSNCGDERGGPFGHETSECKYRSGMTATEVAHLLPEHRRGEYWELQLDRYFAEQFATQPTERDAMRALISRFVDDGPCEYDHHDYCQGHSLHSRPCPHEVAKALLKGQVDTQSSNPGETS